MKRGWGGGQRLRRMGIVRVNTHTDATHQTPRTSVAVAPSVHATESESMKIHVITVTIHVWVDASVKRPSKIADSSSVK